MKRAECAVSDGGVSVVVVKRSTTQVEDERAGRVLEVRMTDREVLRRRPLALSWESIGLFGCDGGGCVVWFGAVGCSNVQLHNKK